MIVAMYVKEVLACKIRLKSKRKRVPWDTAAHLIRGLSACDGPETCEPLWKSKRRYQVRTKLKVELGLVRSTSRRMGRDAVRGDKKGERGDRIKREKRVQPTLAAGLPACSHSTPRSLAAGS